MKLISLAAIALMWTPSSYAREPEPRDIKSMDCKVKNVIGVPIGKASIVNDKIKLALGFSEKYLQITSMTEIDVSATNESRTWEYSFEFKQILVEGTYGYTTTIYQRRLSQADAEPLVFAKATCTVTL